MPLFCRHQSEGEGNMTWGEGHTSLIEGWAGHARARHQGKQPAAACAHCPAACTPARAGLHAHLQRCQVLGGRHVVFVAVVVPVELQGDREKGAQGECRWEPDSGSTEAAAAAATPPFEAPMLEQQAPWRPGGATTPHRTCTRSRLSMPRRCRLPSMLCTLRAGHIAGQHLGFGRGLHLPRGRRALPQGPSAAMPQNARQ